MYGHPRPRPRHYRITLMLLGLPRPRLNRLSSHLKAGAFHVVFNLSRMFENRTSPSLG